MRTFLAKLNQSFSGNRSKDFRKVIARFSPVIFLSIFFLFAGHAINAQTQTVIITNAGNGSWTAPCGVTSITVEAWGGGGAGGGATANNAKGGGGGAGGSYVSSVLTVIPGNTYNLFVGSGGIGDENDGNNGSASWFNNATVLNAQGGNGGIAPNNTTVDGGVGSIATSIGTIRLAGVSGSSGTTTVGGAGGAGGNIGGAGGAQRSTEGIGNNGTQPGGGGGGAFISDNSDHDGGDGGNGQVKITYTGYGYCGINFTTVEPITLVNFASINRTSSANVDGTPALEIICDQVANVIRGNSYNITVSGNTDGNNRNYFNVYIDWNQNGIYDTGERYEIGEIRNSTGSDGKTVALNITVPLGAVLGTTKMRVIKNYGTNAGNGYVTNPCGSYSFGQAEEYFVNVAGNCAAPTSATANNQSTTLTVCNGTAVTLRQVGGNAGGGTWTWREGSCTGTVLNTNSNLDAAYSFQPATTQTYYAQNSCNATCVAITVVVNNNGTIVHDFNFGAQDISVCRNAPMPLPVRYNVTGASAASITAGGLPAGLTGGFSAGVFTISGTPTAVPGTYSYTITPSGNNPCTNTPASITGSITILGPVAFTYSNNIISLCNGVPLVLNHYPILTGGNTATSYSVSPALPAGLVFNANGFITGTPTANQAPSNYTVTVNTPCGSATHTISIEVKAGDQLFNITPAGTQFFCNSASLLIGLDGSNLGVDYQLFRNGVAIAATATSGGAFTFPPQTIAGVYKIKTVGTSCVTTMNDSTVIVINATPSTQFSYSTTNYCQSGNSVTPTFTGSPTTGGVFTASPGGLVFDNVTGVIDLGASAIGTYIMRYVITATGSCPAYTYTYPTSIVISAIPNVYDVTGGGAFCSGGTGVPVGLSNSQMGARYQLYRDAAMVGGTVNGTGAPLNFGNQTLPGNYIVRATNIIGNACEEIMTGNAVVIVNPLPSPIIINPATSTICQGTIMPLSVSVNPPASTNANANLASGAINLPIPDNNATGVFNVLKVTGIPAGATITSVSINFNITHTYDADLLINLKGPNNNVLNIANGIGGSNNNFTNTIIASNAISNIAVTGSAPFTGTFLPQAAGGVAGAQVVTSNVSNATLFSDLYGATAASANGNWILSVRDKGNADVGVFNNWSITINYTIVSNPVAVTWTPITDLYTDPGATVAYVANTPQATVYLKPATSGAKSYTATSTNAFGCSTTNVTNITVNPSPQLTVTADYCTSPGQIIVSATTDISVNNWQWSNGFGAGTVSGNKSTILPNSAATYYVTTRSAANSCPATASISVAQELVVNGDFEAGNTGFNTGYAYVANTLVNGLYPEGTYTVNNNPNLNHNNFWGTDHTTADGSGNFMLVNGAGTAVIWSQTVTVLPNTTYYFSAYATSLNGVTPFANLVFRVNGVQVGIQTGLLPTKPSNNNPGNWIRFYGNWPSGIATTALIEVVDLETAAGGNDFGLDDISFGTLSTFLNLTSATGTNTQTVCANLPITPISYEVGGNGTIPLITGLPPGLSSYWNGRDMVITGTPAVYGDSTFQIRAEVCAGAFLTRTGTLNILAPSKAGNFTGPTVSACYNTSGSIAVTGTVGNVLKWQSSAEPVSTWTNITNITTSQTYPALTGAVNYRIIARNGVGCKEDTATAKLGIRNLWTGKNGTDWQSGSNWSDDNVPTATPCPTVYIPNTTNKPVLSTGTGTISNLNIFTGASLTVSNAVLQIAGTITNAGVLDLINGTLELNGTSTQTIAGSIFRNRTLSSLTVSGNVNVSATANDTLNILNVLSFGNTTADLNTGNNITLKSTATGTARVGVLNAGNIVTGSVVVERRLRAGRKWRLLAAPTNNATQSIRTSWQENGPKPVGFGVETADIRTNFASFGFDVKGTNTSVKIYNSATDNWDPVGNTTSPIKNNQGYMVFVAGDRNIVFPNNGVTTLRTKGNLYRETDFTPLIVPAGTFRTIGNPFASPIDLKKMELASVNLDKAFYVWDPSIGSYYGLGAFNTIYKDVVDGDYKNLVASAIYGPQFSVNNIIESGLAFMVKAGASNGTISFNEGQKASTNIVAPSFSPGFAERLSVNLNLAASGGENILLDAINADFSTSFSSRIDEGDIRKILPFGEGVSWKTADTLLAIDRRAFVNKSDSLILYLTGLRAQNYQWEVNMDNMDYPGRQAYLVDRYMNQTTELNMTGNTTHNFNVVNIPASFAADRFIITFKQLVVLPVTFVSVQASKNTDRTIAVKWKVANELNIDQYEVQRSADGARFTGIVTKAATGNNGTSKQYAVNDLSPLSADNFYRIKALGKDGKEQFSEIVKVTSENIPSLITVFPNPVEEKTLHLQFKNINEISNFQVQLYSLDGKLHFSSRITAAAGNSNQALKMDRNIASGSYRLLITDKGAEQTQVQVVVK